MKSVPAMPATTKICGSVERTGRPLVMGISNTPRVTLTAKVLAGASLRDWPMRLR